MERERCIKYNYAYGSGSYVNILAGSGKIFTKSISDLLAGNEKYIVIKMKDKKHMEIKATKPIVASYESYIEEIKSIWDTGILTNYGEKTNKLRQMLHKYLRLSNIDLFVNGHSALVLAIQALDLQGEVITSPFTFISTTNAIVQNGLIPVFGDIDESYNLNPNRIEELITPKTSAIVIPHIFGIPCDINRINQISEKYNLKVIYDGAQAFGTKINGNEIGAYGDITMFSLHAIKVFNSIEGGILTYRDDKLNLKFEQSRNFGFHYSTKGIDVEDVGINAKMNEFQASMGIVNLPLLNNEIKMRKNVAEMYIEHLKDVPGITTYDFKQEIDYNYAYFPIKIHEAYGMSRDNLWIKLKEAGIETRKLYDKLTCDYTCYRNKGYKKQVSYADKVKSICLDLPIYGCLSELEITYICETIEQLRR